MHDNCLIFDPLILAFSLREKGQNPFSTAGWKVTVTVATALRERGRPVAILHWSNPPGRTLYCPPGR